MKAVTRAVWAASCALTVALAGCQTEATGTRGSSSGSTSGDERPVACSGTNAPDFDGAATAYDAPADVERKQSVAAQVSEPSLTTYPSGTKGFRIAKVHLGVQVKTNGVFAISPDSVVLADGQGNACPRPATDPLPEAFPVMQVDETHPDAGDIAFLVPKGADLSAYSVYYVDTPGAHDAAAHWSASGSAPTVPVRTSCDGKKSTYSTKHAKHVRFGHGTTFGGHTVSLKITVHTPTKRTLKPSEKQPNDVDGIAVHVTGHAKGALGFIGRNQFKLVDGSGHLCRYNPLGSTGENLSSALIKPGKSRSFTLIFWMPRGARIHDWTMLYLSDAHSKKVTAYWTLSEAAKKKAHASASSTASPSSTATP